MPGLRAAKKRKTRHAIIEAAIRLFANRGYDKTSIEDLAREAGVGKGTIYGYFHNKEEIFLAFCEEEIDFALAALAEKNQAEAPLLEQLLTLFMSQFRFVTANREFGRILIREMAFPRAQVSGRAKDVDARYLTAVGEILEKARQRGELKEGFDPFLTFGHFYGAYLAALSGWYTGYLQDYDEAAEALEVIFRQALDGLAPSDHSNTKTEGH